MPGRICKLPPVGGEAGTSCSHRGQAPLLRPGTPLKALTAPPTPLTTSCGAHRTMSQFQNLAHEASGPPARLPAVLCPSPACSPLRPSHLGLGPPAPALRGPVPSAVALPSRALAVLALPLPSGSPPPGSPPGHSGRGRRALVSPQHPLGFPSHPEHGCGLSDHLP